MSWLFATRLLKHFTQNLRFVVREVREVLQYEKYGAKEADGGCGRFEKFFMPKCMHAKTWPVASGSTKISSAALFEVLLFAIFCQFARDVPNFQFLLIT